MELGPVSSPDMFILVNISIPHTIKMLEHLFLEICVALFLCHYTV